MSNRTPDRITVYDVVAAATEAGEWVNGEFLAVVRNATAKQGNKPSKADLCDPDSPNIKVKAAAFGGIDFTDLLGATCLFGGQGMKVKMFKGVAELTLSDKAMVNVVTAARPGEGKPEMSAAGAAAAANRKTAPAVTPEQKLAKFHGAMKKTALLWLHAEQYVRDIETKLGAALPPELRQSAISSMFITGKDQGLLDIVPGVREVDTATGKPKPFIAPKPAATDPEEAARKQAEAEEAAKAEARRRHEAEEEARKKAEADEDVPF